MVLGRTSQLVLPLIVGNTLCGNGDLCFWTCIKQMAEIERESLQSDNLQLIGEKKGWIAGR